MYHDIAPDDPWSGELCKIACSYDKLDLCQVNQLSLPILSNAVNIYPALWTLLLRYILVHSPQIKTDEFSGKVSVYDSHPAPPPLFCLVFRQYYICCKQKLSNICQISFLFKKDFGRHLNRSAAFFPHPGSPGGHFPVAGPRFSRHTA